MLCCMHNPKIAGTTLFEEVVAPQFREDEILEYRSKRGAVASRRKKRFSTDIFILECTAFTSRGSEPFK